MGSVNNDSVANIPQAHLDIRQEYQGERTNQELGDILRKIGIGTGMKTENYGETLLYVKKPVSADLIILEKGTFVLDDSILLRDLCELNSVVWEAQRGGTVKRGDMEGFQLDAQYMVFQFHQVEQGSVKDQRKRRFVTHTSTRSVLNMP